MRACGQRFTTTRGPHAVGGRRACLDVRGPLAVELAPSDAIRRHGLSLPLRSLRRDTRPDESTGLRHVGAATARCVVLDGSVRTLVHVRGGGPR